MTVCGISGTFSVHGAIDRSLVADMHARLVHRGPDETYSLNDTNVAMKLARLGMTALSDGWQPVQDRTGRYVGMVNGEIYNVAEIRRELGGGASANRVDVAVIPELLARRGIAGLERVDGQFVAAVFDRHRNELTLSRDRFGICPLHYTTTEGGVHFCSELRALVRAVPGMWRLNLAAVDQYLTLGNIVAPRTLVHGVQAVPPGCVVTFGSGEPVTTRYWRFGEFEPVDSDDLHQEIRAALGGGVRDRITAEVEIGAYLSGGFDSSALVMEASNTLGRQLRTFSVAFQDQSLDESVFQRQVAQAAGTPHTQVDCGPTDVGDRFEDMVRYCCYPQRETYNVAAMMLAHEVGVHGVKGVISGEGADELFFGYDSYAFDGVVRRRRETRVENEQAWGRPDFSWEVDWTVAEAVRGICLEPAARAALDGTEFWRHRLIPFSDAEARSLSRMQMRSIADVYVQLSGHLLGDHGDAMLMAHSAEGRYPFLANPVVELALRTGDDVKVVDFEGKACLKAAYAGRIPSQVVGRAKQGFTAYGLSAIADERALANWRAVVSDSGVFRPDCFDELDPERMPGKWDRRLSLVSIGLIIDELELAV